ncbi:MBL fold metallo-hydrolase [Caulobacter sp. Root1455]|uniref:MBL fold metallo-hydrolase n=1 Tax=Caulobacter sp. Root1455 TaxID=1736465 RepID=UPI0006FF6B6C|nr:MBL fold metallo-hydrolase [Caulobacter sp. Root1455]KQZ04760.1 MBL fold metallo-hydrolase [Caulobacter sp. Root1455]
MTPILTFHGAAGCVTGSCARVQTGQATLLIDCGMFQGSKTLKALNYGDFPFDPREIDAVLLTHAHVDHSGLLPKLMRAGYEGPIYATAATRDLCAVMLVDAGGIQEAEVASLNRRNQRRGLTQVEPIYTAADGKAIMPQFRKVKLGEAVAVAPGVTATYWEAGHILGAASIALEVETDTGRQSLLFSGDIGSGGSLFVGDPQGPQGVDHLVVESTYGDRDRIGGDAASRRSALAEELKAAHAAGGPLLIPAFAVERSQELLVDLLALMEEGRAPRGDIFLDSPLAIEASKVFQDRGWNAQAQVNPFAAVRPSENLHFLDRPWDSDGLEKLSGWHIILAASGMCDAGRIRKHLKRLLWRKEVTVLLCGYQAVGTLGRLISDGAPRVSIQGDEVRVRARIRKLEAYSAHADASGLVRWVKARGPVAGSIFLAHGEPEATAGLKRRLVEAGLTEDQILVPELDEGFALAPGRALPQDRPARRLPPQAVSRLDWHNDRAAFNLALNAALQSAPDDAARERLLAALQAALGAPSDRRSGSPAPPDAL